MKKLFVIAVAFSVLTGLMVTVPSWSQQETRNAHRAVGTSGDSTRSDLTRVASGATQQYPDPATYNPYRGDITFAPNSELASGVTSYQRLVADPSPQTRSEIARLMNELRETDDAAKKTELTKQLETTVTKYFDDDVKFRETELTKLEERLRKLRSQLDRRRKAKDEIVQLQIKVLVNDAEGLGLPGASSFEPDHFPATPLRNPPTTPGPKNTVGAPAISPSTQPRR